MKRSVRRARLSRLLTLAVLVVPLAYAVSTARAQVIYVDADSTGANNGSSWGDAFVTLQDGLAAAVAGDEVWVAGGTYKPDQGELQTPGDIVATFQLMNDVAIYGHFLGTEKSVDGRDLTNLADPLRQTVLTGDIGSVGFIWDNTNNVLRAAAVTSTSVLDGFTVRDGFARISDGGDLHIHGGGLYIASGNPTIRNCTFTNNEATNGGGVTNVNNSPTLINCFFTANGADFGGGMSNFYGTPVLIGCTFTGNVGDEKGGGMAEYYGHSTLTNCKFFNNSTVAFNGLGGGMYVQYWSGSFGYATLNNCLFSGNSSAHGGGMDSWGVSTLTNCTFVNNYADFDGGGFGIYIIAGTTLANCVLLGNVVGDGSGPLQNQQLGQHTLSIDHSFIEGCSTYCAEPLDGNIGDAPGADPLFVDPTGPDGIPGTPDDDLRLSAGSPCIDAGDTAALSSDVSDLDGDGNTAEPLPIDLDGNTRVVGASVDMGAYEFQSKPICLADLDDDGLVDFFDLAILLASWVAGTPQGDIGGPAGCGVPDGVTDFFDLSCLLAAWAAGGCP